MTVPVRLPLPPSLYADTAVAPVATPPLATDKSASVAIVGGGFTGLSTALHLAEQGADVLVLEAQEPGWGASGNNGGQINPGLKHDPDQIEADFGPELGRRMIEFSYGTTNFTLDLIPATRSRAKRGRTARCARPIARLLQPGSRRPPSNAFAAACRSSCSGATRCVR